MNHTEHHTPSSQGLFGVFAVGVTPADDPATTYVVQDSDLAAFDAAHPAPADPALVAAGTEPGAEQNATQQTPSLRP